MELQKRLEGSGVDIYLAQPGMSKTGLFEKGDHSKWAVWAQVGFATLKLESAPGPTQLPLSLPFFFLWTALVLPLIKQGFGLS